MLRMSSMTNSLRREGIRDNVVKGDMTMKRSALIYASVLASIAVLATGAAISAQDKYTVKVPDGLGFSEFRGYEDWAVISISENGGKIAIILGNPTMIDAYKAGVPGNGKPFPDGSKIAKLQWKFKKSTEAPFVVDVPDTFSQAFVMERNSKRFPSTTGGWGYALFNYDPASDTFMADPSPADCGNACHQAVKAKGYIFHPYQKR